MQQEESRGQGKERDMGILRRFTELEIRAGNQSNVYFSSLGCAFLAVLELLGLNADTVKVSVGLYYNFNTFGCLLK